MKPVQCPTCELRWNIPDFAQPVITCPRCLAALMNPYSDPMPGQVKPPPLPVRPVLPIEHQVARDKAGSNVGLILLIIVIVVGIVLFFVSIANQSSVTVEGIIGLIVIAAAGLIPVVVILRKKHTVVPALPGGESSSRAQPGGVLDYQRPLADPRKLSPGAFFGQAIGGIILGIVACVFLGALFAQITNGELAIVGVIAPIVVGALLCTQPRIRGLGVGLILALPAAFLLLLGFCAILIAGSGAKF